MVEAQGSSPKQDAKKHPPKTEAWPANSQVHVFPAVRVAYPSAGSRQLLDVVLLHFSPSRAGECEEPHHACRLS